MALREGECFPVRRFADRGIGKNIGDSRVRGDRFNRDRRSAGRGNEIGNRDPRDVIKIKRLRQRVRDLEEIRRLRQRVRDLELEHEMRKEETESETIVLDGENEEEEYPSCYFHPWFYEPDYIEGKSSDESVFDEEPKFDENGSDIDEDECLFVKQVLNTQEGSFNVQDYDVISSGIFVEVLKGTVVIGVEGGATVVTCGNSVASGVTVGTGSAVTIRDDQVKEPTIMGSKSKSPIGGVLQVDEYAVAMDGKEVVVGGDLVGAGGVASAYGVVTVMVTASIDPKIMGLLNISSINKAFKDTVCISFTSNIPIQIKDINYKIVDMHKPADIMRKLSSISNLVENKNSTVAPNLCGNCMDGPIVKQKDINRLLENQTDHLQYGNGVKIWNTVLFQKVVNDHEFEDGQIRLIYVPTQVIVDRNKGGKFDGLLIKKCNEYPSLQLYDYLVRDELFERVKSIGKGRRFNASFDPGGTCEESGDTSYEVELVSRVKNRFDIPFDPGGFGLKTKLEDEFFFRRGGV